MAICPVFTEANHCFGITTNCVLVEMYILPTDGMNVHVSLLRSIPPDGEHLK